MVRTRFKWKCIFFSFIIIFNVFTKSLPINTQLYSLASTDTSFKNSETPIVIEPIEGFPVTNSDTILENNNVGVEVPVNATRDFMLRQNNIRPGQSIRSYAIDITVNEDSFDGRAVIVVLLSADTREDEIVLHIDSLDIQSVRVGVFSVANAVDADYNIDEQRLEIFPGVPGSTFFVIIEYSGQLANGGLGLHLGHYNQDTYVSMNLHPTYAKRVFPCMDEPTELTGMTFTFNNLGYTHMVSNSELDENSATQFRSLSGPAHLWGMIAHNFVNINIPITNVLLYGRAGVSNQDSIASLAINSFYTNLNEWTDKAYTEIILHQDGRMNIIALPDVSTDWHSLSTVGIWEPYVFMETVNSVKQRSIALPKIAEAMAKQWFGYVIFPQNWRYEWVVSGLASYAAWEMVKLFQGDGMGTDVTMLDVNTLFVTEVIQESLLRDSYLTSGVLDPGEDLFEEDAIRDHIGVNGILKYKAPALMRMMRNVLGEDIDYIHLAASLLVNEMPLEFVSTLTFLDAVNSEWAGAGNNDMVGDLDEYLEPWIDNNGYPLIRVSRIRGSGVLLTQERFGFSNKPFIPLRVPITFTTSTEQSFDIEKVHPIDMFDQSYNLEVSLGDEDWILFNIQGQGYYRVNYDIDLWEVIIETLEEPETREEIHPLNRATLVDDALNIARSGRLDYDIAFRVVLTMEHETEYAVWKAFVRNMNFLRKRLVAYVDDEDAELDQDIYLRMVRRTIHAFEDNIGFYPDVATTEPTMQTLTRGLVMDHACRANYQPCIAAAVDWFYDPNNVGVVNPNIPHEIRPAVYCTMVREGDEDVREALYERLDIEPTHYERLVILESLACSQDEDFINELLDQTIADDSPYGVEERLKIFAAVAESSFANANIARNFMRLRTSEIRNMYGGPEKLEEAFFVLVDNMVDADLSEQFQIWAEGQNNNLDDSQMAADRAFQQINENLVWNTRNMEEVYEWIDENHAPTLVLSVMALCVSITVAVLIQ